MVSSKASFNRLKFCNFKLDSLLEITLAINDNEPTETLFQKYKKLLRKELNIGKVLVYSYNKTWGKILESGIDREIFSNIDVETDLLDVTEITTTLSSENEYLRMFDVIIPVFHNNSALAYVLIGDIDEEKEGISPTIKHLHFIQTLTNIIIVAVENHRLYQESLRQEAIKREMELASKIQTQLIPSHASFPKNSRIMVDAFYRPHYEVGGDYYDFIILNKAEFGFCIADVSGKGMSAAILMSNFQANLRALFSEDIELTTLVNKLNSRVLESAKGERFITLFLGKLNTETGVLKYINAGHNPPLLYKNNKIEYLESGCVGIGMLDDIPVVLEGRIDMLSSKLICFTDGVEEIEDDKGNILGIKAIENSIATNYNISETINNIIEVLNIKADNNKALFDDISILGLQLF